MKLFLFLLLLTLPITGCGNFLYISRLGWYQSYIIFQSKPIHEVLEAKDISDEIKEKIIFIQEVKRFGEEKLGLKKTGSYSKFFNTKGPLLFVITASEKDKLKPYSWKFPILGRVTYKSFFNIKDALKEKKKLEKKGFDTFIRGICAYSTLGWFEDPIFSPMLELDIPTLANIIIHEMVHTTIYFKGETEFNEQIATFIGNEGAIQFLEQKYGIDSEMVLWAKDNLEDDIRFSNWMKKVYKKLSDFYDQPIPREEKLRQRVEIFNLIKAEFREIKDEFRRESYKSFESLELNNAIFLAYHIYVNRLDLIKVVYEYLGKDIKKLIQFLKEIKDTGGRPLPFLEKWLEKKRISYLSLSPSINSSTMILA